MENINIKKFILGPLQTNCYCIKKDNHLIVIDPSDFTGELSDYIRHHLDRNITPLIFCTHNHFDHITGVAPLIAKFPGTEIFMHELDAETLTDPLFTGEVFTDAKCMPFKVTIKLNPEKGNIIEFPGIKGLGIIHTPGHTQGSISLIAGNSLFCGDLLFQRSIGRTDLPSGDLSQLCKSLEYLFEKNINYTVYPGHGEKTFLFDERGTVNYFCSL